MNIIPYNERKTSRDVGGSVRGRMTGNRMWGNARMLSISGIQAIQEKDCMDFGTI